MKFVKIFIFIFGFIFLTNVTQASFKYIFKTKLECNVLYWGIVNKEFVIEDGGKIFMAFDKNYLWMNWDPINQDFLSKHKIYIYNKEKIEAEYSNEYIKLNRIDGSGSAPGATSYENCKKINSLPKKKIKQKF